MDTQLEFDSIQATGRVMRTPRCWLWVCVIALAGCGGSGGATPDSGELCGNGVVDPGEDCDEGSGRNVSGTGCEPGCTFSCVEDSQCDDGESCNGEETCNTALHRCQASVFLEDGTECTITVEMGTAPGKCVGGYCGRFCDVENDDCDDENVCNGAEVCDDVHTVCRRGQDLDCNDGLRCTIDSCDPIEGCSNELIDGDGDGHAPSNLQCDERGGDCDDGDPEIFEGAPELCDEKDNDCDGEVDELAPFWFTDCDGDDYPAADAIQSAERQCNPPSAYDPVNCPYWTTRNPSNVTNQDCDDLNAMVYPGAVNPAAGSGGYWNVPYCVNTGMQATGNYSSWNCGPAEVSFDYNCSGTIERSITSTNTSVSTCSKVCWLYDFGGGCAQYGCSSAGWTSASVPLCGQTSTWRNCDCDSCGLIGCFNGCSGNCVNSTTSRRVDCR
jgi:hypothetical protein